MNPSHGDESFAPGPRFASRLSFLWQMRRDPLRFYVDAWREYGDIVRFDAGGTAIYLLVHPRHVRRVLQENAACYTKEGIIEDRIRPLAGGGLTTAQGEDWIARRRVVAPLFQASGIGRYADPIAAALDAGFDRWDPVATSGVPFDLATAMSDLNFDIIGRVLLGRVTESGEPLGQAFRLATTHIERRIRRIIPVPARLPSPSNRRFGRARQTLERAIREEIVACDEQSGRSDILAGLVSLVDDSGNRVLDDDAICDEILAQLLGWHAGLPMALFWTLYLLTRHPEAEHRLRAEVDGALGRRMPGFDDIGKMTYSRMVVQESLRLFPPLWGLARDAVEADEIDGYRIAAGSRVVVSPYLTHRHESFWSEPDRFDPDRFSPERAAAIESCSYFPFGRGLRRCVGEHVALMQMQMIVCAVVQRYAIVALDTAPARPVLTPILCPATPQLMRLERRVAPGAVPKAS